jgi:hypothetical protein
LIQKTPKLIRLFVNDLQVDNYAQRSYDPKWAERLAKDDRWNPGKEGVYRVSRRGHGQDYVFDGQHRRGARLLRGEGDVQVPCLVYEGMTRQEEAEQFLAFNVESRKPNNIDTFRLQVVAEQEDALEIQDVLDKHGLRVEGGAGPNSVAAVTSLRWLYNVGGTELLDDTLTILNNAWPHERDARAGEMLKGLGYFLVKVTGQPDVTSLTDKMTKSGTPAGILGRARQHRMATGRPLWEEVAHRLLDLYNYQRSSRRLAL